MQTKLLVLFYEQVVGNQAINKADGNLIIITSASHTHNIQQKNIKTLNIFHFDI